MTLIRNTTLMSRPIEEVFDFAVDLRNEFKWNPKVRVMTKLTGGPIGLGTRMAAKWTVSGHIELECTEYERPYRWTWANGGPIAVTFTVTLSEEAGARGCGRHSMRVPTARRGCSFRYLCASCERTKRGIWVTSRRAWSQAGQPKRPRSHRPRLPTPPPPPLPPGHGRLPPYIGTPSAIRARAVAASTDGQRRCGPATGQRPGRGPGGLHVSGRPAGRDGAGRRRQGGHDRGRVGRSEVTTGSRN